MKVLVTGAAGFVGRNLVENLKNIRDGKNRTRPNISVEEIYEYDRNNTLEQLDEWCGKADFVFNLAGVNRPQDPKEFKEGNFGFASTLLDMLKKHHNTCPVMLSSSLQATLAGRFGTSSMDFPSVMVRSCSSIMRLRPVRQFMSIASPISSVNGIARTIIQPWEHSAITLQMTCPSRSMIQVSSLKCFSSMT